MKKPVFILLILFLSIGSLTVVRSMVSARITTSGLELSQIREETQDLRTENAIIREQIFSLSALTHLSQRAEKVGFVQSNSVYAVSGAQPIARGE
jgi:uncharacterized glyoxalase superfamily metalloenzyme YdcJ